ncbi:hypothetical protein N7468_009230 [Penicillium chermesinum]|uniref:Large ribosomal subunit protein bL21m n=1 Tax=Penicillium chermesinum TaxID=63820 RepID=A0A9W9TES0_9EURO|nr:uncharacterized protein N7468_009230 [Penicillium chermesinum]KAJ5220026.1 hypothetical protein N7468_009230 [Penicillium chermesinum]
MFSRSVLRGFASELRCAATTISSAAPLPQRACLHQTARLHASQPASSSQPPKAPLSAEPRAQFTTPPIQRGPRVPTDEDGNPIPTRRCDIPSKSNPPELHRRPAPRPPYLLTEGDHIRLPFLMPNVRSGDILRFNRASVLGSRDYTLKGSPVLDERLFTCRVRVIGTESEPMRIKEKTKRRQRHVQGVRSKHRYTMMRVMEVSVHSPEQLLAEGAIVVEDSKDVIEKAQQ